MFHVTREHTGCHKCETNVKCLVLLTIVLVADAAFVGDDRVDAVFTCNYHVWRALSVLSARSLQRLPVHNVPARTGWKTVTDPRRCEFIAATNIRIRDRDGPNQ